MPKGPANLTSQAGRNGLQDTFRFGGGADTITATDDGTSPFGYIINGFKGDDMITGSDYAGPGDGSGAPGTDTGDLLIGGDGSDQVIGGLGDDTIFGGNEDGSDSGKGKDPVVSNSLFGDGQFIFQAAGDTYTGGDDIIRGGDGDGSTTVFNQMVGDVQSANGGTFNGGGDTLISGMNARDTMVGDFASGGATQNGGADTFVFGPSNGIDIISDFELAKDTVNLTATGLSWADLDTNAIAGLDDGDDHVTITAGGDTLIDLGAAAGGAAGTDTLRVSQVTGLGEGDFDFVLVV